MEHLIGKKLGQYEIREKIGQGGMAHVFKAYQPSLDRFVAVKILSPLMAEQPGFTERFQREAQSIARLQHPNILQVYDFGKYEQYYYIVMRYVKNSRTLGDLMREKVPLNDLVNYVAQVADALNYAHEQGIIHRDVKPGNILVEGKWALLSDFGLVKMTESSSKLTGTGTTMGTPAYMSPEQAKGQDVDHRTDIYALGIILYRILTGTIPHDAPTPLAIAVKRSTQPVPPPSRIKPDIPADVENVVLRTLEITPDARYSSAVEFAEALKTANTNPQFRERTITDMVDGATQVSKGGPGASSRRKNIRLLAVGGAIGGVVIVGILIFFLFFSRSFSQPAAQEKSSSGTTEVMVSNPTNTPILLTDTPTPIPPGTPSVMVKTRLEVRNGPGPEYDLLGYLPEGAMAEIISRDESGQWWQIQTPLSSAGVGWIEAASNLSEATDANNVPIALVPPTPTPTPSPVPDTSTPTATSVADTPTPTLTSTSTPTPPPAATATPVTSSSPTATKPPTVPTGEFTLLKPASLDEPTFGLTEFEWQWGSPLAENQGFEVRVWRDGEPPSGVHDAVLDNKEGQIEALGNNTYRLVADISETPAVRKRRGEYNWTVVLVQIEPEYKDLGIQANPPGRLRFETPGDSGGGDGDGGGGGSGGGSSGGGVGGGN